MAFSTQRAVSDGTLVLLGVSIGYIKQADISVFYDNLPAGAGTWNWVGNTSNIAFTPAVPNGVEVLLARTTQIDKVINRFSAGAGFTNQSMDTDFLQMLYLNQEAVEGAALTDIFNDVDFHGKLLRNIGTALLPGDALPLGQFTTLADQLEADVLAIKTQVDAVYDSFDDRYLGAKAVIPTLDNDGNALIDGALYFDTVIGGGVWRAWNAGAWVTLPAATAVTVGNTPAGNIAAVTVQAAINELDTEKAALAGATFTGPVVVPSINGVASLHQNDIVNGDFRIAQAGTSFAAAVNAAYDLDGWVNGVSGSAVFTVAQVAGSVAGRLARRVTITTADAAVAAGDYVIDETKIEGYNIVKYVGNTFTVAFRAQVPVAGIHCVYLKNAGVDRTYVVEINFPTANVWQDCSFTVVGGLPTAGTWNYTNGVGLYLGFVHLCDTTFHTTAGAWNAGNLFATANQVNDCATVGNVWALEKVTLNLGTVAAVSEISYEQELIRCHRYYERIAGAISSTYPLFLHRYYKVKKRAIATVALVGGSLSGADFDSVDVDGLRCPAGTSATGGASAFEFAASARL